MPQVCYRMMLIKQVVPITIVRLLAVSAVVYSLIEYIENEYEFMDDRIEIEESNLSESEDEPMATGSNRKPSIYK